LDIRLETVPNQTPYLFPDPERVARWSSRLGPDDGMLRVGLIWAGGKVYGDDSIRSPGLKPFLPLLGVPGTTFYGLQVGPGRQDLEALETPLGTNFIDLGKEVSDFADTAAIMTRMDLVISSCTATVHLAGGLRRPTWVVIPKAADWRWMLNREDSPWYPELRLFRQDAMGREWGPVIGRVKAALTALTLERKHGVSG
ncbi:MAG: hypothetical protein ABT940_10700, partial [Alphaproteobacteria bacterium]